VRPAARERAPGRGVPQWVAPRRALLRWALLHWVVLLLPVLALCSVAFCAGAAGSVTIGMQLEPPVLDPTSNPAAAISQALYGNVYEGLVQFAPDGSVAPLLAESWDVSDDGTVYTFHLRHGVRFHDGRLFDAASAKFSLERGLAVDSVNPQKSRLQAVRRIEVLDGETLRLSLSRRSGSLLESLAWGSWVMVSQDSAGTNGSHPVGTGPFRFSAWRRGDALTVVRNPDYWGGAPSLDAATFKFIADPNAAYAALMAGDVDAFHYYPAPESFAQFAADPRFKVFVGPTEGETILSLNNRRPPLNDVRVRRAIASALDRKAIIDGAMFGYGTPIGSHFPPRNPAYVDLTGQYPHDVAQAKKLLAEAGYPNGFALSLKLPPPSYARRGGEIIAAQLAEVGIHAVIENLEWAQWLDQVYGRHDFDMSIVVHAEPMDYDIYARDDYYFGYTSASFKALIASLEDTVDPLRRRDLLQQVQHRLADDAVNGFLFQYPQLAVWDARFQGLGFDNVLGVIDLRSARYIGAPSAARVDVRGVEPQSFRIGAGSDGGNLRHRASGAWRPGALHDGIAGRSRRNGHRAPSARPGYGALRTLFPMAWRSIPRRLRHELHLSDSGANSGRRTFAIVAAAGVVCVASVHRRCLSPGARCRSAAWDSRRLGTVGTDAGRIGRAQFLVGITPGVAVRRDPALGVGRRLSGMERGVMAGAARLDAPGHRVGGATGGHTCARIAGFADRDLA